MEWLASVRAADGEAQLGDIGPRRARSEQKTDVYLVRPGSKGRIWQYGPSVPKNRRRLARSETSKEAGASKENGSTTPLVSAIFSPEETRFTKSSAETAHIAAAVAKERSRIERNLHDHAGQYFVGIMLRLAALEQHATDQTLRASLHELGTTVARFGEELRAICVGNRGDAPPGHALVVAIEDLTMEWQQEVGIIADLDVATTDCCNLDDATAEAVFRVIQEALTNVAKHAKKVSRVNVRLEVNARMLKLEIQDDGLAVCARTKTARQRLHCGIVGMGERVRELGGHFAIERSTSKGTRIVAIIPVGGPATELVGVIQ